MDKNEFLNLLCNSSLPSEDRIDELKEIIKQHPYSPLPRFILAKFYYHINHPDKEKYLQVASAYAIDRKVLKRFIHEEYVSPSEPDKINVLFDRQHSEYIEENSNGINSLTPQEEIYSADARTDQYNIEALTNNNIEELSLSESNDKIEQTESVDYKDKNLEFTEEALLSEISDSETTSAVLVQEVNDSLEELRIVKNNWLASEKANGEEIQNPTENIDNSEEIKETEEAYNSEEVSESYLESELFTGDPLGETDIPSKEIFDVAEETSPAPPLENGHDKINLSKEPILETEAADEYEDKGESSLLLDYLTKINSNKEKELENNYRNHQHDLIEKFIKYTPSLSRVSINDKVSENQEDLSERSITSDTDLVSENLAVIMTKQGKIEKAIDIYKKLIWKYPQKKVYFASRIEELKK